MKPYPLSAPLRYPGPRRGAGKAEGPGPGTWAFVDVRWLGGEDSNPQRLDQNQLCYRLHHPRMGERATVANRDRSRKTLSLRSVVEQRVDAEEAVVADDATHPDRDRLLHEVLELAGPGQEAVDR